MAEETAPAAAKVVVAAGRRGRDQLQPEPISAVEAAVGLAIGAGKAPHRVDHRADALRREELTAAVPPVIQQHPPDYRQATGRDAQPALRRKERAVCAGLVAGQSCATGAGLDEYRAGRRLALQIIKDRRPVLIVEHDGSGGGGGGAGGPVEAGIEAERFQYLTPGDQVETLAGGPLDHRSDNPEIEVRVAEESAGRVVGIERAGILRLRLDRLAEADHVIFAIVADAAGMAEQHPQRDRAIGKGRVAERPAELLRDVGVEVELALVDEAQDCQCRGDLGHGGDADRVVRGDGAAGAPIGETPRTAIADPRGIEAGPRPGEAGRRRVSGGTVGGRAGGEGKGERERKGPARHQATGASSRRMVPASASISARHPTGRLNWSSTWPNMAPV